jgi:hypothetical protein
MGNSGSPSSGCRPAGWATDGHLDPDDSGGASVAPLVQALIHLWMPLRATAGVASGVAGCVIPPFCGTLRQINGLLWCCTTENSPFCGNPRQISGLAAVFLYDSG